MIHFFQPNFLPESTKLFLIRDLELVVGKVPTKDWTAAVSLAKELHAWRCARVRGSQPSHPRPPVAAAAHGVPRGGLFGDDIAFNFDLDCPTEEDDLDRAFPGDSASYRPAMDTSTTGRSTPDTPTTGRSGAIGGQEWPTGGRFSRDGDVTATRGDARGEEGDGSAEGAMESKTADTGGGKGKGKSENSPPPVAGKGGVAAAAVDAADAGWLYSK